MVKDWHEKRGQDAREQALDLRKLHNDRRVWLTLTDPAEREQGNISAAEQNWHRDNAVDQYFKLGYLDPTDYAKVYKIPRDLARKICDTAHSTIRYVAQTGDGSALKSRYLKKLEFYEGEAAQAGSWEAVTKMIELQAKISGSMAATKAEVHHKHDLIGKLTPEMKKFFIEFNQLPREAFEVLGYPIPDSAPSLMLPPAKPAEIIDVYLEDVEIESKAKDDK